jgi:hypothetical protein
MLVTFLALAQTHSSVAVTMDGVMNILLTRRWFSLSYFEFVYKTVLRKVMCSSFSDGHRSTIKRTCDQLYLRTADLRSSILQTLSTVLYVRLNYEQITIEVK